MFEGFIALFRHTQIVFPTSGLAVQVSYTQWGWVQILAGAVVFATGLSLFTGRTWARALGVIILTVSVLINFAWANIFPFWSLTVGDRLPCHLRDHRAWRRAEGGQRSLNKHSRLS